MRGLTEKQRKIYFLDGKLCNLGARSFKARLSYEDKRECHGQSGIRYEEGR